MRLTSILLLATCLHLSAKTRAQHITLSEEHSSLKKVFKEITGQTGYLFVYRDEWLRQAQHVDIAVKDASLQQVLDICFSGQPFTYIIIDKMVVLKEKPAEAPHVPLILTFDVSSLIDVHGRVTDVNGNPLAGATILVGMPNKESAEQMANWRRGAIAGKDMGAPPAGNPVYESGQPAAVAGQNAAVAASANGQASVMAVPAPAAGQRPLAIPQNIFSVYVTDASGEFVLKGVPDNATIFISNVGYETQEIKLNKRKELTIRMAIKANNLQDVAVTYNSGYQILSKERATGSYAKPDMEVFKARVGTQDIVNRLDGLVPGLTVFPGPQNTTANMNGNGHTTQTALIRGTSSLILVPSTPLYVVNGVVVTDFADINPDDIADITVLKDAAAAAIWGARAANGVIVVITKSGKRDSKIKLNYSGYFNYQGKPDFSKVPVLSSPQFIQAAKETFDPVNVPWGTLYNAYIAPHEVILYNQYRGIITAGQANASLDSLASINNMQQVKDIWFRNAFTTNHTLSASGGGGVYSFYSSFSWTDARSNAIGAKNNAYRLNFTQDIVPNKNIRISLNTALDNTVSSALRPISIDNHFLPYQLFKDKNGNSISMPYVMGWSDSLRNNYQARSRVNLDYNPIDEINYGHSNMNNLAINLTGNINIRIWKGLSFLGTYGYAKAPGTSTSYDDHQEFSLRKRLVGLTVAPSVNDVPVYYLPTTGGTYLKSTNDQRNWTVRNQLAYTVSPRNGKDELSLQAGQEANEQYNTRDQLILEGYDEALQTYSILDYNLLSQGIYNTVSSYAGYYSTRPYTNMETRTRFTSYFALASYTLDHKYSVDLSWRQDHSNLFGSDEAAQNKPVWSFGGRWQMAKENFMKSVKWLNDLGLRGTYGITGNSPFLGAAVSKDVLSPEIYNYPPDISGPALSISSNANTTITWEITKTFNGGIDFAILKRRISGGIDVYHKSTVNLIGGVDLNPFTGTARGTGNLGHMVNKGIELKLTTANIQGKDFSWTTTFVFAYNTNKLLSYATVNPYLNTDYGKMSYPYWIGYSYHPMWAYRWAGLDNLGDPQIQLKDKSITKKPNVATADDLVYKGSQIPLFNGGLSNSFRYKGISLSANIVYNLGAVMRRPVNTFYSGRLTGSPNSFTGNISEDFVNRWKKPGDEKITNIPSYVSNGSINYSRREIAYYADADVNVISASYAKLRDITLSYALPRKLLQTVKIDNATVYVQTSNFMIWKNNHYGLDPEYPQIAIPSKHPVSVGINVAF